MNRRAILIGVGATLAVLLVWYFLLWSPRGKAIDKAKARRATFESQAQELESQLQRLQEAKRTEAATRAKIDTLRQAIPDEPNLAQFILDANDAASRSGIDFLSVAPTPPAPGAAPEPTPGATPTAADAVPAQVSLNINITGGYFQILDFVNRLDDLTRIVVIDGMNVASAEGVLSVQITGRMFVAQAPTGTAAPPAAEPPPGGSTTTTVAGATTTTVAG
jgi:Tfp pilus assembly protein PilO